MQFFLIPALDLLADIKIDLHDKEQLLLLPGKNLLHAQHCAILVYRGFSTLTGLGCLARPLLLRMADSLRESFPNLREAWPAGRSLLELTAEHD
jgi:hypothetical protein